MALAFTPFALIMFLAFAAVVGAAWYAAIKGKYRTAGLIVLVYALFVVFKPIKLTTNTAEVNARSNQVIMEKHRQSLKELPPRVTVERKSYEETLAEKSEALRNRSN